MSRLLIVIAMVSGCAVEHASLQTPVTCGATTCGQDQYCAEVCTCCGIDAGAAPSGYTECRATPPACDGLADEALRTCLDHQTGGDAFGVDPRLVSFPCA